MINNMAKILKLKYKTPAPDSPVNESKRGKETPKDPDRSGPTGQGETPKDPAKAGPTGQGETPKDPAKAGPTGQGERVKISPIFCFFCQVSFNFI